MFADLYESSELKAANDAELDGLLQQHSTVSPQRLKELSIKRATVTPSWWALWILFRVSLSVFPSLSITLLCWVSLPVVPSLSSTLLCCTNAQTV